ncbi:unnamed protein product [Kuraishia capsulata CBS 1993]|uniref:LisH domain-containing protein n=1 Tax=Kuraishia capsulata CBS 1993 TaxID=1382522 RepID=W6MX34_9ASCO|nr:uncharacterized protein KUCA_T00004177001 [Kuraishia capsulata CBS 1993]CDK28195.1 unnamed protein product [Kuraishia capsulata CBS 1993]
MSITSDELNYLIWRYLQEGGLEVSAFALEDETKVNSLEQKFGKRIPLGCLVDLVQKGILYSKVNDMVNDENGQLNDIETYVNSFNLFEALDEEKKTNPQLMSSGAVAAIAAAENGHPSPVSEKDEETFITVLKELFKFPASVACDWNPVAPTVLAWGQLDSTAKICALGADGSGNELIDLVHPSVDKEITSVMWNPTGSSLVTCMENGEMRVWSADGKLRNILNLHTSPILTVRWNKNGSFVLSSDVDNKTIVWDVESGRPLQFLENSATFNDMSPAPATISSSPVAAPISAISMAPSASTESQQKPLCLGIDAFWLDNTKFVIPGKSGSIVIYTLGEKIPIGMLEGHTDIVSCISYDRDLHLLASGSDDNTIRIWKGNSYNSSQILIGHSQPISSVAWLQCGDLPPMVVSTSLDGSIKIWNVITGEVLLSSISENGLPILEGQLSPDSSMFVLADTEGNVQLFDISPSRFIHLIKTGQKIIKPKAAYQVFTDEKIYISQLSWNCDSTKISVCVAGSASSVISV